MRVLRKISILLLTFVLLSFCGFGVACGSEDSSDTLKIGVVAKGYGSEYLSAIIKAFNDKTGIRTELAKASSYDWADTALQSGARHNDIDVVFNTSASMKSVAINNYVQGYDRCFADLSDIYDTVPEGYVENKTLKELCSDYTLKNVTWGGADQGYGDGKQYFINYANGYCGIIYNKELFDEYNLTIPRTTTELFALMNQMKTLNNGTYPINDGGKIYPFVYSGRVDYTRQLCNSLWAQYDGLDAFYNLLEGKDGSGNYSAESMKSPGKLSSVTIISEILDPENGYYDSICNGISFTDAQVLFLSGSAFLTISGDWIAREMSAEFQGDVSIEFMKVPVNSDVVNNCNSVETDSQLSQAISYIDGDIDSRPSWLSDEDLEYLTEVRSISDCIASELVAYVPAYSNQIENAKEFLKYFFSKEAQRIMLDKCYGNMAPLNVDISQFDNYSSLPSLQKSKYSIINADYGINYVGQSYHHPMIYAAGLDLHIAPTMELAFGVIKTSTSYIKPYDYWLQNYNRNVNNFSNMLKQAGVTN